jgi:hypothetical protein
VSDADALLRSAAKDQQAHAHEADRQPGERRPPRALTGEQADDQDPKRNRGDEQRREARRHMALGEGHAAVARREQQHADQRQ